MSERSKRIDRHLGERIRARRTEAGLTQEQLGEALGVSYQQIQKYETGANRIGAGRLYEIARRLEATVNDFFEGLDDPHVGVAGTGPAGEDAAPGALEPTLEHGGRRRSAIELVRKFAEIEDPEVRACIAGLVKTVVDRRGHD